MNPSGDLSPKSPRIRLLFLALVGCLGIGPRAFGESAAETPTSDQHARRLVSLIDYVAGDYAEAVRDGRIVSTAEYAEMQDFVSGAASEFVSVSPAFPQDVAADIEKQFKSLDALVAGKADVAAVRAVISGIKTRVLAQGLIATSPTTTPDWAEARRLYAQECASCHGVNGEGDGAAARGLEPPPRNFHDGPVMDQSSPFKFYNALQLGIAGTAMASYAEKLTSDQRWSLAFYVSGLRHGIATMEAPDAAYEGIPEPLRRKLSGAGLSLAKLSSTSDAELRSFLQAHAGVPDENLSTVLSLLRSAAPFTKSLPTESPTKSGSEVPQDPAEAFTPSLPVTTPGKLSGTLLALKHALTQVGAAKVRFQTGDLKGAESRLFDAYLEGFDPAEKALSLKDKDLVTRVEQTFIAARAAARSGDAEKFSALATTLEADLKASLVILEAGHSIENLSTWSGTGDFIASLIIILREGFEAFLVIAALLTLVRKTGQHGARKWVHLGWMSAIVAGLATFALFTWAFQVSGATRETIEAVSTGIAALGLFYVSFWLLNQAERNKWNQYIHASASTATSPQSRIGAMFFVAFIAVYREAAETALFYQALVNGAAAPSLVAMGFVAGCLLLLAVAAAIVRFGVRLPMRQFFLMTSSLMIAISIVLLGKAVNELVNAGFIIPTRISRLPAVDALGIYPLWESVGLQLIALVAAALIAYYSGQKGRRAAAH